MGTTISQYIWKKEDYDPNDPMAQIRVDLRFQEKLLCHNEKAWHGKFLVFEAYGMVFGGLLTTLVQSHRSFFIRVTPLYTCFVIGLLIDMRRVESRCQIELDNADKVIKYHRELVSRGHPPYAPTRSGWDLDEWEHLRSPPLILKRELIENWNYTSVRLPKQKENNQNNQETQSI